MARTAPRQPGAPAGVIFGCNRSSEEESLNGLFGMSSGHWSLVKEIIPGTPCFLFNFNTKVGFLADAQNFAGCSAFVYAVATLQKVVPLFESLILSLYAIFQFEASYRSYSLLMMRRLSVCAKHCIHCRSCMVSSEQCLLVRGI